MDALSLFSPAARAWFADALGEPTEVQTRGWPEIAAGANALLCAPTGSGKTLAAFMWFVDRLGRGTVPPEAERCRVLYISPLKALTVDVERNLRAPLRGIALEAERRGDPFAQARTAVRSGDTTAAERADLARHPADILITTPESLFLMLTSAARETLRSVRAVIVDEIHALAGTKRGAHLALSLERLAVLTGAEPQRIGLSATQRPLSEVARFLGGRDREVVVVDAGVRKPMELRVEVPVDDMGDLDQGADRGGATSATRAPRRSIWPAIAPRLLELIRSHRSTIVFVNSRRLAERLSGQLNDLAGDELVRAHHGSIAREQRTVVEEMLKEGRLPAIIATSSLELGIDMGAVDLVVQVGSPLTVASGLQRIGRAGHNVGDVSRGTIFPTHRGDLVETAAIAERMLVGAIEETRVPRNPLDVLAQQIVAMAALDTWDVADLRRTVIRAYPFADLGERAFEATLDMLDGRYPSEEFAELRARIVWDRVAGTVRGRAGAQRLAVTSGGTIPDRGLYSVNIFEDGRRVGELDEEMVYELRPGETFILGATTWRCVDITPQQVLVLPAPGEPGKIAFWHGDAVGRPFEVGVAVGAMVRELHAAPRPEALDRLRSRAGLDERAASNLLDHLTDQARATGAVPDDRTIVVERFRDQLGDWRLCVLTPFGARVHAPWSLVAAQRLRERMGTDVQTIHSDDGFVLRIADADTLPDAAELFLDPDDVVDAVTGQLEGSSLFASRFRENAARALLLPRRRPGQRTPLWQQRQRSAGLLKVVAHHPSFPILVETYRECLRDVFDLEALAGIMRAVRARQMRVVEVETAQPSPVASSLLFEYIAQYMYDGDAPLAERRAQALSLDRELLAELLGSDDLRELLDGDAIDATELELQRLDPVMHPRDIDQALDALRVIGDLTEAEAAARGIGTTWLAELVAARRAVRVRLAGEVRVIAADDAGRYRDALGVALPPGLATTHLAPVENARAALLRRYARTHVPFVAGDIATRWALPVGGVVDTLGALVKDGDVIAGHFRPGGADREYCHPDVLQRLRRRSLAALRREVEAVPPATLARFLSAWQGVGSRGRGHERLLEVLTQLQGMAVALSVLERDILPARMSYDGRLLDELIGAGEVVWQGRRAVGRDDGRIAVFLRGDAGALVAPPIDPPPSPLHAAIRDRLGSRGPAFARELLDACPGVPLDEVVDAVYDLVWAGEVTNDSLQPLRFLGPVRRHQRRPLMRLVPPRAQGRWSLIAAGAPASGGTERGIALAGSLLQRHGVLTREAVAAEGVVGGFAGLYPVLRAMEEAGRIRRGYFVEGCGAAQFALPGAVDALRSQRGAASAAVLLAAVDPASLFGAVLPWPALAGRAARAAGAYTIVSGGELRFFIERGGRSLLTAGEPDDVDIALLAEVASRLGRLDLQTIDGHSAAGHPLATRLRAAGFVPSTRGLVLYPPRPHAPHPRADARG
ncbi:MAG: DEAD/DEAH box helicase [Candidatus Dormibacteraeota bacterium]|uniref:DEAD/DEAH box helicase n=1 Tax=Candidatus Amunia macphersoniae TaxID=3127014 RepID=A0A934KIG9_9BACT|nr:DEAD/DEAH box helicase [Candidatus Dormibacteraeota bacterium]